MHANLTLYSYWRSSSSWRVRLQLACKGIAYTNRPVHLVKDGGAQHAPDFIALNPMRQIPYLHVGCAQPFGIAQSLAIMEYIEEAYPTLPTLPASLQLRAHTRQLAEIINSGTQPLQNLALIQFLRDETQVPVKPFCAHWIGQGLLAYQQTMQSHRGEFSVGDEPSIADFCLIPQLYNARRFGVDLSQLGELLEVEEAMKAREFFAPAHPDAQPDADPEAAS